MIAPGCDLDPIRIQLIEELCQQANRYTRRRLDIQGLEYVDGRALAEVN